MLRIKNASKFSWKAAPHQSGMGNKRFNNNLFGADHQIAIKVKANPNWQSFNNSFFYLSALWPSSFSFSLECRHHLTIARSTVPLNDSVVVVVFIWIAINWNEYAKIYFEIMPQHNTTTSSRSTWSLKLPTNNNNIYADEPTFTKTLQTICTFAVRTDQLVFLFSCLFAWALASWALTNCI